MNKEAKSQAELMPQIKKRWSPRSFSEQPVKKKHLIRLMEAARWAPSCFNEQPWRFIIGIKNTDEVHEKIVSVLAEANQVWAEQAPILLIMVAKSSFTHNNKPNKWSEYDVGQAAAYITLQAMDLDLFVHQMAGFDRMKTIQMFNLEEEYKPVTVLAIGYRGDSSVLPQDLRKMEESERQRKNLDHLIVNNLPQ